MTQAAMHANTSDGKVLDLLRRLGALSVSDLAREMGVTATAVRQRLIRLMAQGLIERNASMLSASGGVHSSAAMDGSDASETVRAGRGRPTHRYSLTDLARQQAGNNYPDLAVVLWDEIRAVKDPEVRRGLLERVADAMAGMYRDRVQGATLAARMDSLKRLFDERSIPLDVTDVPADEVAAWGEDSAATDVPRGPSHLLTVAACPYPGLAERDRGICAAEKMMFAKLLEQPVKLSQCRLDGHACCQFETN